FIKCFRFFPIVGTAHGLRQPLHARDLAAACLAVLNNRETWNRAYNLAGAERLTYRVMVERIFAALRKHPRFIQVPRSVFHFALQATALHPRYRHLTPAMAERMNQDMVFDISDAARDFGFSPQAFRLEFKPRI
ncbi:MAG: NAD(P)-dependent oxidoreductase, partial [Gammaproteobacteria bacterium]